MPPPPTAPRSRAPQTASTRRPRLRARHSISGLSSSPPCVSHLRGENVSPFCHAFARLLRLFMLLARDASRSILRSYGEVTRAQVHLIAVRRRRRAA